MMLDNTDAAIEINPARESNAAPKAGRFADTLQGLRNQADGADAAISV